MKVILNFIMPKSRHKGHASKKKGRKAEGRKSGYVSPEDPEFQRFAVQLAGQGLALLDVAGDGNCLFRALADQLRDGHSNHVTIRRKVAQFIRDHKADFLPFIDSDIPFDKHVASLGRDGEYAGNDAIVAFARCYGVDVVIHQVDSPNWEVPSTLKSDPPKTIHIAYLNREHYCSLQPLLPRPGESSQQEGVLDEAVERVVVNTGCQDFELVEQVLRENAYDADLAIVEVLQLMTLSESATIEECSEQPTNKATLHACAEEVIDDSKTASKRGASKRVL